MRAVLFVAVLLLGGCAAKPPADPQPPSDPSSPPPLTLSFFLKPGRMLAFEGPASAAPVEVPMSPTQNAFATEDVERHLSKALVGFRITKATAIVHYASKTGTVDPFANNSNPGTSRHLVLWLGSPGLQASLATVEGPSVLEPNRRLSATVEFALPKDGFVVAPNETLELLVAPLIVTDGSSAVWLVDHETTPSRIDVVAERWDRLVPVSAPTVTRLEIAANSGLFTGAVAGQADRVRAPVNIPAAASYVRVDVDWVSTTGPKSDLDFTLFAPDGSVATTSTTPYQNEAVRLWDPLPGTYVAEVVAYSGAQTKFDLAVAVV